MLTLDLAQHLCETISHQVRDCYPELTLKFILFKKDGFHAALSKAKEEIAAHPAASIANSILQHTQAENHNRFLGLAAANRKSVMGIEKKPDILALFCINIDSYNHVSSCRSDVYRLLWEAFDMLETRMQESHTFRQPAGPLVPRRSTANLLRANLCADIFSVTMGALTGEGHHKDIQNLSIMRSSNALEKNKGHMPEYFPFAVTHSASAEAIEKIKTQNVTRATLIPAALYTTNTVSRVYDDQSLKRWMVFCKSAQDMAWRDLDPDIILGAAMNTSEDPFIRATAHLVAELTGILPSDIYTNKNHYNPFGLEQQNADLHDKRVSVVFDNALQQCHMYKNNQALLKAADTQNNALMNGCILGWCANALQAAATAFAKAQDMGRSPSQAAQLEFEGVRNSVSWDHLRKLGEDIIRQKRLGYAPDLKVLETLADHNASFKLIKASIEMTQGGKASRPPTSKSNDTAPNERLSSNKAGPIPTAKSPETNHLGPYEGQRITPSTAQSKS